MSGGSTTWRLEVIACSAADAAAAQRGGADRVELVRDLAQGGLTPDPDVAAEVIERTALPVRVMLRDTADYSASGIDRLAGAAEQFAALGAAGFVLGFLEADRLDLGALDAVLRAAPAIPATFHRAFEALADPLDALEELADHPRIDRVLTSGEPPWLDRLQRRAAGRLTILAGGGVNAELARRFLQETAVREIHIGRAARSPATNDGAVDSQKVRAFRAAVSGDQPPTA